MNPLFIVPSWQLPYDKHKDNKDKIIKHLGKYKENNISLPNISSTNTFVSAPNIHIDPTFEELVGFLIGTVNSIKPQYNLAPSLNLGLSSMYASITTSGGLFRPDMKGDDFLTGLYFLNTPPESGLLCIRHLISDNAYFRKVYTETDNAINNELAKLPMPEGNIVIFPSYLDYFIAQNNSKDARHILHFSFRLL